MRWKHITFINWKNNVVYSHLLYMITWYHLIKYFPTFPREFLALVLSTINTYFPYLCLEAIEVNETSYKSIF